MPSSTAGSSSMPRQGLLLGLPPGLQLPSVSPEAVAAMAAMHFAHVSYTWSHNVSAAVQAAPLDKRAAIVGVLSKADSNVSSFSSRTSVPVYIAPSGGARAGVEAIVDALGSHSTGTHHTRLNAGLSAGQLVLNDGLVELLRSTVFPAFEFIAYGHEETFALLQPDLLKHASKVVARLVDPLPTFRTRKLRELEARYGLRTEDDAVALAKRGLLAIERALRHAGVSVESSQGDVAACPFIHGTTAPSTADCFAYAAVAVAASSRVAKSSKWATFQIEAGLSLDQGVTGTREYPLACHFARSIATRYFEQYSGLHFINLPPTAASDAKEVDPYARGRGGVILGSAVFALSYMVVANIKPMLEIAIAVLEAVGAQEEEEGDEEGFADDAPQEGVVVVEAVDTDAQ